VRIKVFTEAGSNVGLGHLTRCTAVCQGFEEKGISPELIVKVVGDFSGKFEYKNYRILDWMQEVRLFEKLLEDVNLAIVDSYLADEDVYRLISKKDFPAMYFDDTQRLNYPEGIIVNEAIGAENISYMQRNNSNLLLGLQYTPLRKVFWDIGNRTYNNKVNDVLITFGGTSDTEFVEELLTVLSSRFSGIKWHIVLGSEKLTRPAVFDKRGIKVYFELDGKGIYDLMMNCDFCISAGGQTIYELARVGTPAIAVCWAENQKDNLNGWKNTGFIRKWFRPDDDDIFDFITEEAEFLMEVGTKKTRFAWRRYD
jgi:UDP-2,4-diacetamido-2,4,6-trideoxy-beta-L-altropyranose hydrolase